MISSTFSKGEIKPKASFKYFQTAKQKKPNWFVLGFGVNLRRARLSGISEGACSNLK
jgi:hypothetical protein